MIGLGRMGAGMARRLMTARHEVVVHDVNEEAIASLASHGAKGAKTVTELVEGLAPPRHIWLMIPAALVEETVDALTPLLGRDDVVIDGGNSHYRDAIRRSRALARRGIEFVDVGVSGGVWGQEQGYCLMVGGGADAVERLEPVLRALAPGAQSRESDVGASTAREGYLHCGPSGAGHFVKMVHNGIEYGLMAAYAEGFDLLRHANAGMEQHELDAETAPMREGQAFAFDFDLPEIAELWRHGTVIRSWLLDLTAQALSGNPDLVGFDERISDSGEGRWAVQAAVESGSSASVLALALFERFASQNEAPFANRLVSAMRRGFGGHGAGNK